MQQEDIAKQKLDDAREKLELLQNHSTDLNIRTILESAAILRNNICNDPVITDCSNSCGNILDQRKQLLDDIQTYQQDVIQQSIRLEISTDPSSAVVADFDKAKISLSRMIEEELEANLFSETEEPHLFNNIEQCKTHLTTLHQVNDNCLHNRYKVLIMGDFQSGKSTTLDALCDGRHISAIGDGTATSAVLVSATYGEKESMNIVWRNKEQFKPIFHHIIQYLPDFGWDTFDLDDKEARTCLAAKIDDFRRSENCPSISEGDAKFLMLAAFVLHFYNTAELKRKKASLQSISDISNITRFPKDGESKWKKSGMANFCINDTIFIFIERVDCHVRSNTLKDLNCTVIDSPGLFNSSYDTMVTEAAMIDAHAIIYILPYQKGIGQDVCKSLFTIRDNYKDVHTKLFVVNNLQLTRNNAFYDSNCEQIRAMFGADKDIYPYDAKLSYLAQLQKSYGNGALSNMDYSHLMQVVIKSFKGEKTTIKFNLFNEAWNHQIHEYVPLFVNAGDSHEKLLDTSGFSDMIIGLKRFITLNKAHAVILSDGVNLMTEELESIKDSLYRLYIEPYCSSSEILGALWSSRIEKAEDFQAYMLNLVRKELFQDNGQGVLCKRISDEEGAKLFTSSFYHDLATEISSVLYEHKTELLATKLLFKSNKELFKQRFTELAMPWIRKTITEIIWGKINYLLNLIQSRQDTTMDGLFVPVMDKVEEKLKGKWQSLYGDDKSVRMENYMALPKHLSVLEKADMNQNTYTPNALSSNWVDLTLLAGLVADISSVVASIAAMISGWIIAILCDPTLVTAFLAMALGLGGLVAIAMAPDAIRRKFINILSKEIQPKLEKTNNFNTIIHKLMETALNKYVDSLSVNIQKMKNERDWALIPNSNQESLCFRAVETILKINSQIITYEEYKQKNIREKVD